MAKEELTPMQRQYQEMKARNKDCILFFRLGDFYEMFNEDAKLAARELDGQMDEEQLLLLANRWEIRHGGVSGRTAQQFIHYLAGKESETHGNT